MHNNEPYIVAEVPYPKSLFSMVVDIVQCVGSADWVTTPPQCSGLSVCMFVQSIRLVNSCSAYIVACRPFACSISMCA